MWKFPIRHIGCFCVAFVCLSCGCENGPAAKQNVDPAASTSRPNKTLLLVMTPSFNQLGFDYRSVANATADLVANELATIDWQQRPLAQLSLSRGAVETLSVLAKRNDCRKLPRKQGHRAGIGDWRAWPKSQ